MVYSFIAWFDVYRAFVCRQINAYPDQFQRMLFFFSHFSIRINALPTQGGTPPAAIN